MTSVTEVELDIEGMTCASCATRIERKLNKLPGVEATVNYATEKAKVRAPDGVDTAELISTVVAAGYAAALPAPPRTAAPDAPVKDDATLALRSRLIITTALTIPVVLLSMIPALQFTNWQWLALTLAAPVAVWGAWPFHRAALVNARHGATTMDTLISVGVIAAFGWSLYALFFGMAGMPGMHMTFSLLRQPGSRQRARSTSRSPPPSRCSFSPAATSRPAPRSSRARRSALLELGAKDATVLRDGVETRVPVDSLVAGRPRASCARREDPVRRARRRGHLRGRRQHAHRRVRAGRGRRVDSPRRRRHDQRGGRLVVEVTRVGADTELARLRSPRRGGADRQGGGAAPRRPRLGGLRSRSSSGSRSSPSSAGCSSGGSLEIAFTAAVATLIIACPCALGLATPTALLVGTGRGSQLGILIRGPQVLEQTRAVDTIVLDKTGTITTGHMAVSVVAAFGGVSKDELLLAAASAEDGSEHPVARAIVAAARGRRAGR